MKENDDILSIEVQGHTDDTGSAAGNRKLSQDRAKAVLEAVLPHYVHFQVYQMVLDSRITHGPSCVLILKAYHFLSQ